MRISYECHQEIHARSIYFLCFVMRDVSSLSYQKTGLLLYMPITLGLQLRKNAANAASMKLQSKPTDTIFRLRFCIICLVGMSTLNGSFRSRKNSNVLSYKLLLIYREMDKILSFSSIVWRISANPILILLTLYYYFVHCVLCEHLLQATIIPHVR
jgi:hypothetical protein